jgi:hypothetical protein
VSTSFSGPLDPASLAGGVLAYDATDRVLLPPAQATAALSRNDPTRLSLVSAQRWKGGHTYLVAVLSWQEGSTVRGVRGANGQRLLADQAFLFLRSPTPLIGKCAERTSPACQCPNLTDPSCRPIVDGLSDSQARQLEPARQALSGPLSELLALAKRERKDVVVAWTFTISRRPFAAFDLTRGQIPFPSDLLLENPLAAESRVRLPVLPTDTDMEKALKTGLNTLDGFSTTGSVQFPVDTAIVNQAPVAIDRTTVTPMTARLINITPATIMEQPAYTPAPLTALLDKRTMRTGFGGQILLSPGRALLGDGNRYAAVLLRDIKDAQGEPLTPAPATLLITQAAPLVRDGRSAIPSIADEDAARLELSGGSSTPAIRSTWPATCGCGRSPRRGP